jgi:hypothetical protein
LSESVNFFIVTSILFYLKKIIKDYWSCVAGASVEVSPVMGKGFDLSSVPDAKTILIFATGSGIR